LLYKALIKRDFGLIEDAEKCTSEAIKLSPGLTEARYQNAQYNALLNRPEKAIPLLKKAIKEDIVYCLKILWEQDFKQISSEIAELYEKIRNEKNEKIKEALEKEKKNVILMTNAVKGIEKLGYSVPQESSVELLAEGNSEIDILVKNNSIFDAHIAGIMLPLLSKKLKRKKELLRRKGNELHLNLDSQIQGLSAGMTGKKKKGGSVSFFIHFLCGQIVALPFGWFIGIPLGICITEGLLFAICFYVNVIQPQSQWKDINTKQNEQDKLLSVMKKL
jgi:tetratricopeptide (TPR) repeat protein